MYSMQKLQNSNTHVVTSYCGKRKGEERNWLLNPRICNFLYVLVRTCILLLWHGSKVLLATFLSAPPHNFAV